jgi:hypothetical protein
VVSADSVRSGSRHYALCQVRWQEKEIMKLKSENQKNRAINGNRFGDLTLPDRYRTGSKNGYSGQVAYPFRMAGVPKREYPSCSVDIRSAIPEGIRKQGDI